MVKNTGKVVKYGRVAANFYPPLQKTTGISPWRLHCNAATCQCRRDEMGHLPHGGTQGKRIQHEILRYEVRDDCSTCRQIDGCER
ncbi:MAG: hypothetical protein O6948_08965, partial [Deltaproteobacteria bacterium]|nr:hypothetical protein [Deltaproteobacteria bacterium]